MGVTAISSMNLVLIFSPLVVLSLYGCADSDETMSLAFLNACSENDYSGAEKILSGNTSIVNHRLGLYDSTLLHVVATGYSSQQPVLMVVEYGAEINARDALGQTPLDCAIAAENIQAMEALNSQGASCGSPRNAPLNETVEMLRDEGIKVDVRDTQTKNAPESR
jgi:hypothetical protein